MGRENRQPLRSLELGRFLAAFLVLITHFSNELANYAFSWPKYLVPQAQLPGAFGVQYFFVLSGFVMMTAHRGDFGRAAAVPKFWWRRLCRIYPMYWLALVPTWYYFQPHLTVHQIIAMISLWPNSAREVVTPAWTLRFEVLFYVLFGLCLLPRIGRPLLAAWVLATIWNWRPAALHDFLSCPVVDRLEELSYYNPIFLSPLNFYFFAGLAAAACPRSRKHGGILVIAGMLILIGLGPWYDWGRIYGPPVVSAAAACGFGVLILGWVSLERSGAIRIGAWAETLGAISYPLYILYLPIIAFVRDVLGWWHTQGPVLYLFGLVYLAFILAVAAAAAFWIDKPVQRFLRRLGAEIGKLTPRFGRA